MTARDAAACTYGMLGPLAVTEDGRPIAIGGPKPKSILLRLLLEPGSLVSVDALVDAVWEERAPVDAVKNVQIYVARMRKLLPEGALRSGPNGYLAACEPDTIDATRYERLIDEARRCTGRGSADEALRRYREAESLWRGEVLADVRYASFAQTPIAFYEQLHEAARDEENAVQLDLGLGASLVPVLERLVRDQPLRERRWGQLMVAYYQAGQQGEALRAYARMRETFVEEMGLDPSPEMRRLEQRILDHDPSLVPAPTDAIGGATVGTAAAALPTPTAPTPLLSAVARRDGEPAVVASGSPDDVVKAVDEATTAAHGPVAVTRATGDAGVARALLEFGRAGEVLVSGTAHALLMASGIEAGRLTPAGWVEVGGAMHPAWFLRPRPSVTAVVPTTRRGVLPSYRNAFLGRGHERDAIATLLDDAGAVTLVGPGGIGKTRLAVEFATQPDRTYPDGVWVVDLGAVEQAGQATARVAEVLGLPVGPATAHAIGRALSDRAMLVVLDNCEQVSAAVAELVQALTASAPDVHVIVTSRTRLGLPAERTIAVAPLDSSGSDAPAADLFLARATEHGLDVPADEAVARLCASVDGMPLAIELLVAQLEHLTVHDLLARMDDQMTVLAAHGGRGRHASMRAAFESSVSHLDEHERDVLVATSVFRGPFDIETASAVCEVDVTSAARGLVGASLWVAQRDERTVRYRQLEPIRQFAYARLVASGRSDRVHGRHAELHLRLVDDHLTGLRPLRDPDAVQLNLHAAQDWNRTQPRVDLTPRIAAALLSMSSIMNDMQRRTTLDPGRSTT